MAEVYKFSFRNVWAINKTRNFATSAIHEIPKAKKILFINYFFPLNSTSCAFLPSLTIITLSVIHSNYPSIPSSSWSVEIDKDLQTENFLISRKKSLAKKCLIFESSGSDCFCCFRKR